MKLKLLQNTLNASLYSPINEDYYYEFDYPKYRVKNTGKYVVLPIQSRDPNDLPLPKTALDYEVWATVWGFEPPELVTEYEKFLNPESNKYKGIVGYATVPRGDTLGENGYRDHRQTGYTLGLTGSDWTEFKQRLELTPKGRRVIDVNSYWWSEIYPFTPKKWHYYKNTTDGTTYENTRFLTPWVEKITQDTTSSFNAFLTLAQKEGISFDYLITDNEAETYDSMNLDGYFSREVTFGKSTGITTDARHFSAILADPRFTNYKFPKTGKSFADLFFDNYIDIANADPNIVNKPETDNNIQIRSGDKTKSTISNFVDKTQTSNEGFEFSFKLDNYLNSDGAIYRRYKDTGAQFSSIGCDTLVTGAVDRTFTEGVNPIKLLGQTLDDVKDFIIGEMTAIAVKNSGIVIPWGIAITPELNGTTFEGEPYTPEFTTLLGDLILPGTPTKLLGITLTAKSIALTSDRFAAIKTDDSVVCWGGISTTWDITNPSIRDTPAGLTAVKIVGGQSHFIALQNNGGVTCWGDNTFNQCDIPGGLGTVKDISAGLDHTCVLLNNNGVVCWGDNTFGQCNVPAGLIANQVVCGKYHTKAVKSDGSVILWGVSNEDNGYPLGSDAQKNGLTLTNPNSSAYIKALGVSLNNIHSIPNNYFTQTSDRLTYKTKVVNRPLSSLEILHPFTGVTFSGSTGLRSVADYWTPYGCEGSITCGCGPLGSRDIRKSAFDELAGYTYSLYSLFHVVAPAWRLTAFDLSLNNYWKSVYHDTLKKSQFPSYNAVQMLTYEYGPISADEMAYSQDSNLKKLAIPPVSWINSGKPFYMDSGMNLWFTSYADDFGTNDKVEYQGSYRQAWDLRSGYITNPVTDIEKYNFNGYLDINAGIPCSEWNTRLIRYPVTNKFPEGENRINFYAFAHEYLYKMFVHYVKDMRHMHRSDPTLWERFTPWIKVPSIWGELFGFSGDVLFPEHRRTILGYWYELNFQLLVHGAKLLQSFQYKTAELQKTLDIWRTISNNSRVRPCSNSTGDVNALVDRLILADAFENCIISGGKSLKTGEYIWRVTVPITRYSDGFVTLTRADSNTDFPDTIVLDKNSPYPENRFGAWVKSKNPTPPQYV